MRASAIAAGTGGAQILPAGATIYGYSVRETAAAAASLVLRSGTSNAGPPIAFIGLAASGTQVMSLPAIDCPNGVYVDRLTGTTEVVVYSM